MFGEWKIRGIRGATTVEDNTYEEIEKATLEMLNNIVEQNQINIKDISHVVFTLTHDLNAGFPAKAARVHLGWTEIPMICTQEIPVPDSLEKCIRVLIVVNTSKEQSEIRHVYLNRAKSLRPDIVSKDRY